MNIYDYDWYDLGPMTQFHQSRMTPYMDGNYTPTAKQVP